MAAGLADTAVDLADTATALDAGSGNAAVRDADSDDKAAARGNAHAADSDRAVAADNAAAGNALF